MAILALLAGGIDTDGSGGASANDGVRRTLGQYSGASFVEATSYAPLSGLRGIGGLSGSGGGAGISMEIHVPTSATDSADVPIIPADAARTWIGCYFDAVLYDTVGAVDAGAYHLAEILGDAATGGPRYIDVVCDASSPDLTRGTSANHSATSTTYTDTAGGFNAVSPDGKWILTGDKKKGKVASHTDTVLTLDANGWIGGQPANSGAYNIQRTGYPKFKFRITDGTTNWDSATLRSGVYQDTTVWTLDLQYTPSTTVGSNAQKLNVNGTQEISTTGGIAGGDPTVVKFRWYLMTTDNTKNAGAWGRDVMFYDAILYDNVSQSAGGANEFNTYPVTYNSDITKRPLVTYRRPIANGAKRYDAYTKSSGSDAASLIREIRNVDITDYISSSVSGDKQAWSCDPLAQADVPIYGEDTIYAVQSVGNLVAAGGHGSASAKTAVAHSDGTTDDTGRNTLGNADVVALWYCAKKAPDGSDWTYDKAQNCQTFVTHNDTNASAVHTAGQHVCFKQGTRRLAKPLQLRQAVNRAGTR